MLREIPTWVYTGTVSIFTKKPQPAPTAPGPLEERMAALESAQRRLDSDMDDLWDRFKRWTGRENKRAERAGTPPEPPSEHDRLELLNNQIRLQRAGKPLNGASK